MRTSTHLGRILATLTLTLLTPSLLSAEKPKVLFIGIDGVRRDTLERASVPHLTELRKQGWYSTGADVIAPRPNKADTISGPGWSNLLTGTFPDKHGVTDNTFKGSQYDRYPHIFARVKEARPELRLVSLATWEPIQEKIVQTHADDGRNFTGEKKGDYAGADREMTAACVEVLQQSDPDFLVIYFANVDEAGHKYGFSPLVPEYKQALETVDGSIGKILAALKQRPHIADESWLVLVGTDHGGLAKSHGAGIDKPEIRSIFLIVSGAGVEPHASDEPAYQVDLMATALKHLGITPRPEWELDGVPRGLK